MRYDYFPNKQGLYDPQFEHDSCGVGFVCDIRGRKSHDIIKKGINVLFRLSHRGAVGADPNTGDGAGILMQIPHKFLLRECSKLNIALPESGEYGTGFIFLPRDQKKREACIEIIGNIVKKEKAVLLGWREVPLNSSIIGKTAKETEPVIRQVFIGEKDGTKNQPDFERRLYVIRRQIENSVRQSNIAGRSFFYITNLSSKTISYKGLLMPRQLDKYFLDLSDPDMESAVCLVHSRYSTNTFPTWDLAQPFRFLAHNGEINTLRGNINWMKARERLLESELFGTDIEKIKPVIVEGGSDSASIDNIFELLVLSGRSLQHAMMMLIPAAWEHDKFITKELREFYRYHACFMEPWDGPASIAFTDGEKVGAVLDRNGLRPSRYIVTKSDLVVMASEVGVLDIDPAEIKLSGRLEPGKMFFIDTTRGVIVEDSEIKKEIARKKPYGKWNKENLAELDNITGTPEPDNTIEDVTGQLKAFGYTREDIKMIIKPMAEEAKEPIGSMGNDIPHAFLSKRAEMLYDYFKQLFAQVTNPPIDHIREKIVMSIESYVGSEKNILDETPRHSHKLIVKSPILANSEIEKIRTIGINSFRTKTIYTFFNVADENGFERALERICFETEYAIEKGYSFIILSDRGSDREHIALPALLSVAAVHHHLVRKAIRSQVGILLESAEPREVHHFALLIGYGADCINPYLAYEAVKYLIKENEIDLDAEKALRNYREAVNEGIMKILSKMGISTLRSYRGAQIFEALGLNRDVIDRYFTGTVSRVGGVGLDGIALETYKRHKEAYPPRGSADYLETGGIYQWKRDGEHHLWNPDTIAALQDAARQNDYEKYKCFAALINDQSQNPTTLRGLLKFRKRDAVPLEEVESVEEIVKRFATGAMSFGSISRLAHETIALAMNKLGARSNTGEGGEDPARFAPLKNGESKRSAVKQVASGRFGVTANYLVNADEIQIKIAQGAKPGEGGQLPGHKVSEVIAKTRYTTAGVTLISPPPHHDIYSIEDLAELIFDLKNINPRARISVKLVSEVGVGTVAAGVAKGRADMILISGGDGGTGASPRSSIRHAGLPWELGLSETHQTLVLNNLRTRVRLQTDGQMRTGRDVAIAALLGAEEYGFCTAALIVLGCVMLRHCNLNNCSVGIATQDELLQKRFKGKPEYLMNYFRFVAEELREIMAELGFRRVDEMIGRTDVLELNRDIVPPKAKGVDYSGILYRHESGTDTYCTEKQVHGISDVIDIKLIELASRALEAREPVKIELEIKNSDRTVGAMLSGEVCKRCGENGLLEDTIHCKFAGVAGQSFGAFLVNGVTLELEGLANDYVGKGVSGGKIIIYPDKRADYKRDENIIIGNTAFYGAIRGEAYISGVAGERFCIRNSGLYAVIDGVGDHGCEYMTGGRVVIIGKTGKNFAAGMSGGIAYVYDEAGDFKNKCNTEMVLLEKPEESDKETIERLLHNHYRYTKSHKARIILDSLGEEIKKFVKVMPIEYKQVIKGFKSGEMIGLTEVLDG
ncbi:MAG: glutamate synthase large subunit [Candidatus Omnitrophica bacterium]|nr:glutamate synthase large subunit [Candidatus Omnitrophota bacterium]